MSVVLTKLWPTEYEDIANDADAVKDGEEGNELAERGLEVQIIIEDHQECQNVT